MPLLMLVVGAVMTWAVRSAQQEASAIVIVGESGAAEVVALLSSAPGLRVVPAETNWRHMVSEKQVRVAVELSPDFDKSIAEGRPATVTLHHYEGEMASAMGLAELERFFEKLRQHTLAARIESRGLPPGFALPFELRRANAAPPEKVAGNLFGGLVPYVVLMLCYAGAMYPAIDLTAGEKERGTMETVLATPVNRTALVLGKFLTVLTASLASMTCSMVSLLACILGGLALLKTGAAGAGTTADAPFARLALDPGGIAGVFVMSLPVAVLLSAVLVAVALFARNHKEAQTYVAPLAVVVVLPAMMGFVPGIELNGWLALVPILNVTLACKQMLSGVWHWPELVLIFASTATIAACALGAAVALFRRESVIFRS
jgi:sodium transport system permease protein